MIRIFLFLISISSFCTAEEGKVFLRTDPNGADIFIIIKGEDGKTEQKALGKTASIIKFPEGKHILLFKLLNFGDMTSEIEVRGTEILKPDPVKLTPVLYDIDVVFDEGWQIFVDKVAQLKDAKPITTPATVKIGIGSHEIVLVKEGFWDIKQKAEIKSNTALEIKNKPQKGTSELLKIKTASNEQSKVRTINLLSIVDPKRDAVRGSWKIDGDKLSCDEGFKSALQFPYKAPEEFDFRVVFTLRNGPGGLYQMFATDHPIMWVAPCFFEDADGRESDGNPTATSAKIRAALTFGKAHESVVKVRRDKVECYFDKKLILTWEDKGLRRLKTHDDWNLNDRSLVGIGAFRSVLEIQAAEIIEISGPGTRLDVNSNGLKSK